MRGLDHMGNDFGRDKRANRIVHQDDVFRIGRGAGQSAGHRVLEIGRAHV